MDVSLRRACSRGVRRELLIRWPASRKPAARASRVRLRPSRCNPSLTARAAGSSSAIPGAGRGPAEKSGGGDDDDAILSPFEFGRHRPAAVRLAAVYGLAGLADDWPENRQTCVDVLSGYLRMP